MDEEKRKYKWGRYGIGKYVYKKDEAAVLEETIRGYINEFFLMQKYNTLLKGVCMQIQILFVLYI